MPIPRLHTQTKMNSKNKRAVSNPSTASGTSSATSSPPPSSPSEDALLAQGSGPMAAPHASVLPRPKTSHTTIERRYRTNLNARIQSLREAVPALRVLEEKAKKGKDGEDIDRPATDLVDERGFVDGVKVARKGSKANVLGKAVEYIRYVLLWILPLRICANLTFRVLKKREARLKREQQGLKSLISGLVGGPALIKEWEYEWREKFGGEEKDEIEGEEAEPMSDDEDGDEDDGDDDDGRAKKKAKVAKAPKKDTVKKPNSVQGAGDLMGSGVPEKRKRGRPRKVPVQPLLPEDATSFIPSGEHVVPQPMPQDAQAQPVQQYLLATFALFSFFNSPLTSSSPSESQNHSHSGTVLGHIPAPHVDASTYGWREFIQAFHLIVSALVFFSIVTPWLPKVIKHNRFASLILNPFTSNLSHDKNKVEQPATRQAVPSKEKADPMTLLNALAHTRRGASDEAEQLHAALGVPSGILGLIIGWRKSGGEGFEGKSLEQRAWVRLGEMVALDRMCFLSHCLHVV